jgi:hypothetical protein
MKMMMNKLNTVQIASLFAFKLTNMQRLVNSSEEESRALGLQEDNGHSVSPELDEKYVQRPPSMTQMLLGINSLPMYLYSKGQEQ